MYWRNQFPNPSDINLAYIESVHESILPDLMDHLSLRLEKVLSPTTHAERIHSFHVHSLAQATRARINAINKTN